MAFTLTFTQQPTYLHAVVTGENSVETVRSYLQQVQQECIGRACHRVLIEERLVGPRLNILDVFRIATEGSARALRQIHAIAYVDVNAQGDLMKFAEDVAVNRFLRVAVFSTVPEAERWLHKLAAPSEKARS